jgi:hypothetical protein
MNNFAELCHFCRGGTQLLHVCILPRVSNHAPHKQSLQVACAGTTLISKLCLQALQSQRAVTVAYSPQPTLFQKQTSGYAMYEQPSSLHPLGGMHLLRG